MGKPTICICETKGADQLRGNREADQRLCFRYSDSTIPLLLNPKFQDSSSFLCLYRPVCVIPVRKPHCWISHEAAYVYELSVPIRLGKGVGFLKLARGSEIVGPGAEVVKHFSCSTWLNMKFKLFINDKIAQINFNFRFRSPL